MWACLPRCNMIWPRRLMYDLFGAFLAKCRRCTHRRRHRHRHRDRHRHRHRHRRRHRHRHRHGHGHRHSRKCLEHDLHFGFIAKIFKSLAWIKHNR